MVPRLVLFYGKWHSGYVLFLFQYTTQGVERLCHIKHACREHTQICVWALFE